MAQVTDAPARLLSSRDPACGARQCRGGAEQLSNLRVREFDCWPRTAASRALAQARRTLQALLPQQCALCGADAEKELVCGECSAGLPRIDAGCPRCALPAGGRVCGRCLSRPPPFAATIAALAYAYPVDRLLQRLKYTRVLALADWAAEELASAVLRSALARERAPLPDALVPVPLAKARQRQRGFNQAREIAQGLARRLGLPLAHALSRTGDGPAQVDLAWQARRRNMRDAFVAHAGWEGGNLAIVDDVMTTGATAHAAALALARAGVARTEVWVVARTLPRP